MGCRTGVRRHNWHFAITPSLSRRNTSKTPCEVSIFPLKPDRSCGKSARNRTAAAVFDLYGTRRRGYRSRSEIQTRLNEALWTFYLPRSSVATERSHERWFAGHSCDKPCNPRIRMNDNGLWIRGTIRGISFRPRRLGGALVWSSEENARL